MPTTPRATVEIVDLPGGSYEEFVAEQKRLAAQTHEVGAVVVLVEGVGTKAERGLPFRVVETKPVNGRIDYVIQPVAGGRRTVAQAVHIDAAPAHVLARAAATPVATFDPVVGNVVTVAAGTLRGEPVGQRYVILANGNAGMAKIVRLGGDGGRYFPKCPVARMTLVPATDL